MDCKRELPIPTRNLSPREKEIVDLCVEGLTNEAIAQRLGLTVGTVNTYWLRIKLKVGGFGRTDTVAKIIMDRADKALREADEALYELNQLVASREDALRELRTKSALLELAMSQMKAITWATDAELRIQMVEDGDFPLTDAEVKCEVGATIHELFKTEDPGDEAVHAHLSALGGTKTQTHLKGVFGKMCLRVLPLNDESGEVIGCVSILSAAGDLDAPP